MAIPLATAKAPNSAQCAEVHSSNLCSLQASWPAMATTVGVVVGI